MPDSTKAPATEASNIHYDSIIPLSEQELTPLEAALAYASLGWHVLPLQPHSKAPAVIAHLNITRDENSALATATTDPERIKEIWSHNPRFNVGIATGSRSGITVIDVDAHHNGLETLDGMIDVLGREYLDSVPYQITCQGGRHYIASYTSELNQSTDIFTNQSGIDIINSGYIVAYPSYVVDKEKNIDGSYIWEADSNPLCPDDPITPQPLPSNWLIYLKSVQEQKSKKLVKAIDNGRIPHGVRNDTLASIAGTIRRRGIGGATLEDMLAIANKDLCDPPLPDNDITKIANSISRYAPGEHINVFSIGTEAANNLLKPDDDTWLVDLETWSQQEISLKWFIKNWVRQNALMRVYGAPGSGKSFLVLDWALTISSGKATWHGHKVTPGEVVYFAGEGYAGIPARYRAWKQQNPGLQPSVKLSLSGKPLDTLEGLAFVRSHLKALDNAPGLIIIDTQSSFYSGDENNAKDAQRLIDACKALINDFRCAVLLVHHTGHDKPGERATRAKGSIAFKGAMDIESHVMQSIGGVIKLEQTKSKDTAKPENHCFELHTVGIAGAFDEDGEQVTSAVLRSTDSPEAQNAQDKILQLQKHFENAWLSVPDYRKIDGEKTPFLSRDSYRDYLEKQEPGKNSRFYTDKMGKSQSRSWIQPLIDAQILTTHGTTQNTCAGWCVIDPLFKSVLSVMCS